MGGWIAVVALVVGCVMALHIGQQVIGSYSLPPGPPGLPWVGNIIGIDACAPWKTYAKWARIYGDIVYSRLLGRDIIIINSEKVAKDLLEKRSSNYSDRPYFAVIEMCGLDFHSALLPYGDLWRLHRRFFHQTFRLDAVPRFLPFQHRQACNLLRQLFYSSERLDECLFEYTTSAILNSTYGLDQVSRKDDLIDIVKDSLKIAVPALRPDVSIIIGAFPPLLHLPSWFLGFKRQMAIAREFSKEYLERPFEYALQRLDGGSVEPFMVHDALQHLGNKGISPEESWMETLKNISGSAFLAASETSTAFLKTFFLMMVLNPDAQEKAQAQIDAVVGGARLPTMNDRPLLPFVDAILRETFRYNPVLPLGVPHATLDNDVYNGFYIPKGAIVLANLWSMAHDEPRFPNADAFIPERFLHEDGSLKPNEIEHIAFGFGRRICVGRYFADMSVWAVMAKVLAVFKILKPLDENGVEIPVEPRFSTGITIRPLPFKFRLMPRLSGMDAEKLEQLIAASAA